MALLAMFGLGVLSTLAVLLLIIARVMRDFRVF